MCLIFSLPLLLLLLPSVLLPPALVGPLPFPLPALVGPLLLFELSKPRMPLLCEKDDALLP